MSNTPQVSLADIKLALKDETFRNSLPESLQPDVQKFLQNPNCSCNMKIYQRVLQEAEQQVVNYFPDKKYLSPQQVMETAMQNTWTVLNCNINELEENLKKVKTRQKANYHG